jgi:hypothetical protein
MLQMVVLKKLKGNTLPEVLIALCIVAFCSTLSVTIYLNIQQSTLPFFKIRGNELASEYLKETIEKTEFFDNTFRDETFLIKREIKRDEMHPDCLTLSISVFSNENKLLNHLKIVTHAE